MKPHAIALALMIVPPRGKTGDRLRQRLDSDRRPGPPIR
jgi:hypothetical protein